MDDDFHSSTLEHGRTSLHYSVHEAMHPLRRPLLRPAEPNGGAPNLDGHQPWVDDPTNTLLPNWQLGIRIEPKSIVEEVL
jgi:hypothetical protein